MTFDLQMFAAINEVRAGLTNFDCYYDSRRFLGEGSADLPEFASKTITVAGAGVAGEMDLATPGHFENAEITIHWRTIHDDLTLLNAARAHSLTLRGAQNVYDAATGRLRAQSVKILVRGVPTKMALGKFEPANETDSESTLSIDYIKIWVDGSEILEYDKFNFIYRVNGTDYMDGTRTALAR